MTPFDFLEAEFPELYQEAGKASRAALPDPRTSCIYARRVVELAVNWAFINDRTLAAPYGATVSQLLKDETFGRLAGAQVVRFARDVVKRGNDAVHGTSLLTPRDSVAAASALFQFTYWFARTYGRDAKPSPDIRFDPRELPRPRPAAKATDERVKELEAQFEEADLARKRLQDELLDKARLQAALEALQAEVAQAKQAAAATADTHDYSEAETRAFLIDLLLAEAGWTLTDARNREFEVDGMPPPSSGKGYVDYVLWGADGKPLALVEAKRTTVSAQAGQQQAKLYADALEAAFGQRPVIYTSNGYDNWLWDDIAYPPRPVQGFATRDELALLVQRRTSRKPLAETNIDETIVERYYQSRCIRHIDEAFETQARRKALVVMATGAGKTRTVVALADQLVRANWAKRILFLADRTELVKQAVGAFKTFMPDSSPVNLTTEHDETGLVYVSTYQTMMNLIDETDEHGVRRFGVNHFDLVVIDEAHRSVFNKYRAIFDYFDSLLVGLTATPRNEISHNTYGVFDLADDEPTDVYDLHEAVADGYLVPPRAVSVPLKFVREGIRYADLNEEERELWEGTDWGDDPGGPPNAIEPGELNTWLFNADTVDQVLKTLMTDGITVAGGDRLGKTIIFAKSQAHAEYIDERFNANYPHLHGEFARIITHQTKYASDLIDKFRQSESSPHIAISVNMLDTGIDVPEVVNLVFFKPVRSKTMFWQMIGRGTRLCPDLFGPGLDKTHFQIFDYCQNFEYFDHDPVVADVPAARSVGQRRFVARLDLAELLRTASTYPEVRAEVVGELCGAVASMHVDNFVVRPHREIVERFSKPQAWDAPSPADVLFLTDVVAKLPTQLPPEPEVAKRFDVLMLHVELAMLRTEPAFTTLRDQVRQIAGLVEARSGVPAVAKQLELLADIQTDEWWEDVTLPMLEQVRTRVRDLVGFIERAKRTIVYTDFADEMGEHVEVEFAGLAVATDFERFRTKARAFLVEHSGEFPVEKVRRNWPITPEDMAELQRVLAASGIGDAEDFAAATAEAGSFGLFVRTLVGLDRAAAKEAFAEFLVGHTFNANQIEFVNLIVDALTQHGIVEPRQFYESPFTDLSPQGPEGLFTGPEVTQLIHAIEEVRHNAEVA